MNRHPHERKAFRTFHEPAFLGPFRQLRAEQLIHPATSAKPSTAAKKPKVRAHKLLGFAEAFGIPKRKLIQLAYAPFASQV